jgi:DNA polymerase epsilon subunit 2
MNLMAAQAPLPEPPIISARDLSRAFKQRGFIIQANAVRGLQNALKPGPGIVAEKEVVLSWVDNVIAHLTKKIDNGGGGIVGNVVTEALMSEVVAELTRDQDDIVRDSLQVISAFDTPIVKFDTVNKSFYFGSREKAKSLHGTPESKVTMYRDRLDMIQQRLQRNKNFAAPSSGFSTNASRVFVELSTLDSLIGLSGRKNLMGILVQREEGQYYLEDLNGSIRLDLKGAKPTAGLFTEGCIVVVDGILHEEVFYVKAMGFPPPEDRGVTMRAMQTLDLTRLVGYSVQEEAEMIELEQASEDAVFVTFSDVHLDNPAVFEKIKTVFDGFDRVGTVPQLFMFLGNFTSRPFGQGKDDGAHFKRYFDELGDLIKAYPAFLKGSRFVFVPGPTDPGAGNVLPRQPLPQFFTDGIRAKVANVEFTSNPCRIRYYTQEIVVCRQNILNKMRRHCVVPPADNTADQAGVIAEHLVKTLMDQSHLCPLPMTVQPVYWNYDNALRLYPLPDLLILGDYYDQFHYRYQNCAVLNPGSFPTDFSFICYRPSNRGIEFSSVAGVH